VPLDSTYKKYALFIGSVSQIFMLSYQKIMYVWMLVYLFYETISLVRWSVIGGGGGGGSFRSSFCYRFSIHSPFF
jgi:hypothetical protein